MSEKTTQEKDELNGLIQQCVNAVAEVLAEDNRVLFVGRITVFHPEKEEIQVDLEHGAETPLGIVYDTELKLQVHLHSQWKMVVMLYGNVMVCTRDYWIIKLRNAVSCADDRRAFRQKVRADGWITWKEEGHCRQACRLVDISLVGVAFESVVKLSEGTDVDLVIPYLVKGGITHELPCTIVSCHSASKEDPPRRWRYGCSYRSLSTRKEDQLCRDIFQLQARSINRAPRR